MKKIVVCIATLSALFGCASREEKDQPAAAVEDRAPPVATAPVIKPPVTKPDAPVAKPAIDKPIVGNHLTDPANILSKRSIYYDYDSSLIKDEYKPIVAAHAKYLSQNRSTRVTVQGNTDERGSREYNIALGQRRADSVRQMMTLLGVQESQIETVSFGEEKPRAGGQDESSYSQN